MREQFQLAGLTFRHKEDPAVATLRPKGLATIVPEPDNRYDSKALKVMWDGHFIGYVPGPKSKNPTIQEAVLKAIASGEPYQVEIVEYRYRDGEDWNDEHRGQLGCCTLALCTGGDGKVREHDGVTYGRISDFVSWFHPGGYPENLKRWEINHKDYDDYQRDMRELADKGTAMHAAMEAFYDLDAEHRALALQALPFAAMGQPEGLEPLVVADLPETLLAFCERFDVTPLTAEERLFDHETGLSGQYDRLAEVYDRKLDRDLGLTVLDWKSGKMVRDHQKWQVGWYAVVKGRELGKPVGGIVCSFGGKFSFAHVEPKQAETYYAGLLALRTAEAMLK